MKNKLVFSLLFLYIFTFASCKNQSVFSSESSSSVSDTDSSTSSSRDTDSSTYSSRSSSKDPISYTEPEHEEITSIKGSYRMIEQKVYGKAFDTDGNEVVEVVLMEIDYFYIDLLDNNEAYFVFDDENTDGEEIHKATYEIVFDNRLWSNWNYYCDFTFDSLVTVGSFDFAYHETRFSFEYTFDPMPVNGETEPSSLPEWNDIFSKFSYDSQSNPPRVIFFVLDEERTSQLDTIYSL